MPTWKLTLEYDGTAYVGWQRQLNGLSIQEVVEQALARIHAGDEIQVTASGRTDAGVHARGQVISFRTDRVLPQKAYERGLSAELPPGIAVVHAEPAPDGFDARRWARGKRYVYRMVTSKARSPLRERFAWHVWGKLDVDAMRHAAHLLLGTHDFSAFRGARCTAKTTVRELRRIDLIVAGDELVVTVEGSAFLKHMVRNIVGTLVEVGHGKRAADSMPALLASGDRGLAGKTAPAHGLCLDEVFYDLDAGPPKGRGRENEGTFSSTFSSESEGLNAAVKITVSIS